MLLAYNLQSYTQSDACFLACGARDGFLLSVFLPSLSLTKTV